MCHSVRERRREGGKNNCERPGGREGVRERGREREEGRLKGREGGSDERKPGGGRSK